MTTSKPRVLILAEAANPELTSVALIGYSLSNALRQVADIHLVTELRNRDAFLKTDFPVDKITFIDNRKMQGLAWNIAKILRGGNEVGWTIYAALYNMAYPFFEKKVWSIFKKDLQSQKFDLVHRITPVSPTTPSPLAKHCKSIQIPFVLGPLNGGIPWPKTFNSTRRAEREWLSYVREVYRIFPGIRQTRKCASAIIAGSVHTYHEMIKTELISKFFYIPENGFDASKFKDLDQASQIKRNHLLDKPIDSPSRTDLRLPGQASSSLQTEPHLNDSGKCLKVAFVGRLVPYKGADMLIESALPFLQANKMEIDVFGDGPEAQKLKTLAERGCVSHRIHFKGWLKQEKLFEALRASQIFCFPSIREFGGGVVIEAMAAGLIPIVIDYGGPPEFIPENLGYKLKMGTRTFIVSQLQSVFQKILNQPDSERIIQREQTKQFALENLTWSAKSNQILKIYRWLCNQEMKPSFPMPFFHKNCIQKS